MRHTPRTIHSVSTLALLALGACEFSIDPGHLVRDAGSEPADACTSCAEPDAGPGQPADDGGREDAQSPGQPTDDGGGSAPDAGIPDAGSHFDCIGESDCAWDEFCTIEHRCEADCTSNRGCVGPAIARLYPYSVLSEGNVMVWSTEHSKDDLGNILPDGAIWRWTGVGEPEVIVGDVTGTPELVQIVDDFIYFHTGWNTPLNRVSAVPGSASERLVWQGLTVSAVWSTSENLYWTAASGPNELLYRRPRAGGPDQQLLTRALMLNSGMPVRSHTDWSTGTDQFAFSTDLGVITVYPLAGGPPTEVVGIPADQPFILPVGEQYLAYSINNISRLDLATGERRISARPGRAPHSFSYSWSQMIARGPWVYWLGSGIEDFAGSDDTGLVIGRFHIEATDQRSELASVTRRYTVPLYSTFSGRFPPMFVNAAGDAITYYHPTYERLFTIAVDPLPCSGTLACPAGLACTSGTCT